MPAIKVVFFRQVLHDSWRWRAGKVNPYDSWRHFH